MLLLSLVENLSAFFTSASNWALAIGGIGLVVFVHEAGHFFVAKRCGVRVEIFSLGFGPRLFGFRRGDTDYRISLVPIGGYVKMAGDNPGDNLQGDGSELPSKSVGQRFAIFSAGVVMNLIFALVALPLALAVGVQFTSTRIGAVQPGEPAWLAGLAKGDDVVSVGSHKVADFNDVIAEVALSGSEGVAFEITRANAAPRPEGTFPTETVTVVPRYDRELGRFVIGIGPAFARTFEIARGGPAQRAGITASDRVVRFDGRPVASVEEFDKLRQENRAERVTLGVVGEDGIEREVTLTADLTEEPVSLIGIKPFLNKVKAVRGRAAIPLFLAPDDEVLALVQLAGEQQETLAPIRDADELAEAFELAAGQAARTRLLVRRGSERVLVGLPADVDRALASDVAFAPEPVGRSVRVVNGYPAALAGLPDGAAITHVDHVAVSNWDEIKQRIEKTAPRGGDPDTRPASIEIAAELDGQQRIVEVTPRYERLPIDFGMLRMVVTVKRSYPFLEAVRVGVSSAGYMIKNVYLTLKKMLAQEVAPKNLSGILTIAYVSRSLAESGIATLFFFLSVLSLNLAFLNLLPIPVLDGGHLFFLIVEKVKGSPVSEKVMGFSQLVGLMLVLALLLFVTYNDLRRFLY